MSHRRFILGSRMGTGLLLILLIGLFTSATAAGAGLGLETAAPTPIASGGTVRWAPIGDEVFYKVAISTDARGSGDRSTEYLLLPALPGVIPSYTPDISEGQTVYVGVSADGGLTWSAEEAVVAPPPPVLPEPSSTPVPVADLSDGTVQWAPVGDEVLYKVALSTDPRGAADRSTQYVFVPRVAGSAQTYAPDISEGQTVYVGVSADEGMTWSADEAVIAPPPPVVEEPTVPAVPSAPVLSVHGNTVSWTALPGVTSYKLATILNPASGRSTTYTTVTGTSVTPTVVPGQTVGYGLAAADPVEGPWADEVTIKYPAVVEPPPSEPTKSPPPVKTPVPPPVVKTPVPAGKIIGANDASGWGLGAATVMLAGHINWARVEIGGGTESVAGARALGFKVLAIVNNPANGTLLNQIAPSVWGPGVVAQILANPGISIAEAGNEIYLKGGVPNPVQYGKMYLAAVNAMKLAGVHIPLLFNMTGDYPRSGGWASGSNWSQDAVGGGWLRDAVAGVPGLAQAIVNNGISTHPYGTVGENREDSYGVSAVAAQESVARSVLGSVPPFYLTEFGFNLKECGKGMGACSEADQAAKLRASYNVLLADPHVAGIWWYQSHDDGTGAFGFMDNDNTTRPAFDALSQFAKAQGQ